MTRVKLGLSLCIVFPWTTALSLTSVTVPACLVLDHVSLVAVAGGGVVSKNLVSGSEPSSARDRAVAPVGPLEHLATCTMYSHTSISDVDNSSAEPEILNWNNGCGHVHQQHVNVTVWERQQQHRA